jgi:hypothetical protein
MRHWWLNRDTETAPPPTTRSKPMRDPRPFAVTQNGTFLFVIHAYTARQAATLVAARLADTADILIVALDGASR